MKSAAESGWDFSTRWFIAEDGTNQGGLRDVKTRNIVPVDLNALICMNARLMSDMFSLVGDQQKSQFYFEMFNNWKKSIQQVSYQHLF